jgi:hypothetical protein
MGPAALKSLVGHQAQIIAPRSPLSIQGSFELGLEAGQIRPYYVRIPALDRLLWASDCP